MLQEVYVYAYGFTLEKGKKCLPQEVAIEMWRLIFSAHPWPLLESWYDTPQSHNAFLHETPDTRTTDDVSMPAALL